MLAMVCARINASSIATVSASPVPLHFLTNCHILSTSHEISR